MHTAPSAQTDGQPTLLTGAILLADDGSEGAALARRAAADIAGPAGLPLHLVTAWGGSPAQAAILTTPSIGAWEAYEEAAHEVHETVRQQLAALGATAVSSHVVEGTAAEAIAAAAESIDAALVVIGSHRRGPLSSRILGSVADEVIRATRRPVLVARGDAEAWPPSAVIVGDSPEVETPAATRTGAFLAGLLAIPVTLVRAVAHPDAALDEPLRAQSDVRGEVYARATQMRHETGMPVGFEVIAGDPAGVLLHQAAQTTPPALIAVTRRLHHGLGERSVTTAVLHHATGPVLVVPDLAGAEARDRAAAQDG